MFQKSTYTAGVMCGYAAVMQCKYLKCFLINLAHNEEPIEEWLASVNDERPDPDQVSPDIKSLSEEDYIAVTKELEERQKLLAFLKAVSEIFMYWFVLFVLKGFSSWLAYQYMKDHDIDPHDSGTHNPYRILLHKSTGTSTQKLQQKAPVNV